MRINLIDCLHLFLQSNHSFIAFVNLLNNILHRFQGEC